MDFEKYQDLAMNFASEKCYDLNNAALGLTGEAGKVAEIIKKHIYHGDELDKSKVINKLGDILWYIVLASELMGTTLNEVARLNIGKLQKRYPNEASRSRIGIVKYTAKANMICNNAQECGDKCPLWKYNCGELKGMSKAEIEKIVNFVENFDIENFQ